MGKYHYQHKTADKRLTVNPNGFVDVNCIRKTYLIYIAVIAVTVAIFSLFCIL